MEIHNEESNKSPLPPEEVHTVAGALNFYDALKEVGDGARIAREEWKDENVWGFLNNGKLSIHMQDGKVHEWIVSDGDLNGADWKVL
jgi:hypothetical protein